MLVGHEDLIWNEYLVKIVFLTQDSRKSILQRIKFQCHLLLTRGKLNCLLVMLNLDTPSNEE